MNGSPRAASVVPDRRSALDGVRAVAVGAVIVYHLGWPLRGGFLGVDVFFVLSGYLITRLLLEERGRSGRIDLVAFWARRARRLLPALLLLLVVCAVVVMLRDPVASLDARRGDLLATLLYVANWHFIAGGDSYFALFVGQSPLEHMWTLAIEEQFYLAWPVLVVAIGAVTACRIGPLLVLASGGIVAAAVAMALVYDPAAPTRAYFGTDTRASALLIGAALAMLVCARPELLLPERGRRLRRLTWPLVGLVVATAFFLMKDQEPFYYQGGAVLFAFAVAYALWILETDGLAVPARLLGVRPVAWLGTISYGLYLWHWPLIQWVNSSSRVTDAHLREALSVGTALAVATASFYLLERPVRAGRVPWLRASTCRLAVVVPVAVAAVAALAVITTRVPDSVREAARLQANLDGLTCPAGSPEPVAGFPWCVRVEGRAEAPTIVNVGDSTSQALQPGLTAAARRSGARYVQAGRSGCSLLAVVFPSDPKDPAAVARARQCVAAVPQLIRAVAADERPDLWVISDRWLLVPLLDRSGAVVQPGTSRHDRQVTVALRRRLTELTAGGARVVIAAIPPPGPPLECAETPAATRCTLPLYSTLEPATVHAAQLVRRVARGLPGVAVVSVDDRICPGGQCPTAIGGRVVRYDGIHLTKDASRWLAPLILARAKRAGVPFSQPREAAATG